MRGDIDPGDGRGCDGADAAAIPATQFTETGATAAADDDRETPGTGAGTSSTCTFGTPGTFGIAGTQIRWRADRGDAGSPDLSIRRLPDLVRRGPRAALLHLRLHDPVRRSV